MGLDRAPFMVILLGLGALLLIAGLWRFHPGGLAVGMFFAFISLSFLYGFVRNEVRQFGIRDDAIWWHSPRWPSSQGSIPLVDIRAVTIWQNGSKLDVTLCDGKSRRVPCYANSRRLEAVFRDKFPNIAVTVVPDMS